MTFFRYRGVQKLWSFSQMGLAPRRIGGSPGLNFWKLMGSGAGTGFSLRPDFSAYAFLGVWEDIAAANTFFTESPVMDGFVRHSAEQWTVFMRAIKARGTWNGVEPFEPVPATEETSALAVITRASIRRGKAMTFWRDVPEVSRSFDGAEGLLFSKGVGELPGVEQATFSVWRDLDAMRAYAYQGESHREVIRKTREIGWYSEDMFARLQPFASTGTWDGRDPLAGVLQP